MNITDALQLALKIGDEQNARRAAVHYALAVSTLETDNGNWPRVPAGAGSNNFGAIIKYAPEQTSFQSGDKHADGSGLTQDFRTYPTPEDGYRDFWHQLMHPNVLDAASSGSGTNAVALQHANGYFEADPGIYGTRLANAYARILDETGEPRLLTFVNVGQLKKKTEPQPAFQLELLRQSALRSPSSGRHSGSGGAK